MKDFLNPKSMLTPGVAGTLMMFLVNGIAAAFPELAPRYLALGMSFLIGAAVVFAPQQVVIRAFERGLYWVLNSLIVFVVGFGTTNLAANAASPANAPQAFLPSLMSSAVAQEKPAKPESVNPSTGNGAQSGAETTKEPNALKTQLEKAQQENAALKRRLEQMQQQSEPQKSKSPQQKAEKSFFRRW